MALVEMIIGDKSLAIATLTRLSQTPYGDWPYSPTPITAALLRLDPIWDPLRADPVFQKLCEEKQPGFARPSVAPTRKLTERLGSSWLGTI